MPFCVAFTYVSDGATGLMKSCRGLLIAKVGGVPVAAPTSSIHWPKVAPRGNPVLICPTSEMYWVSGSHVAVVLNGAFV